MPARTKYDNKAILSAAVAEITETGFDGASVVGIARRLGAPSGSIYHRYPTKQHLLGAVWVEIFTDYQQALEPILERDAPLTDLATSVVELIFGWVEHDVARANLLMRFRTEDFDEREWPDEVVAGVRACNAAMAAALARLADRHELDHRDLLFALVDIPAAAARRSILLADPSATALLKDRAKRAASVLLARTPS